jgi:hypothetical protein
MAAVITNKSPEAFEAFSLDARDDVRGGNEV